MHRLEQADPHHLRDPARVVAVRLVDLLRRQQSLHVPRLDTDHRQVGRHQRIDQPLRQRASLDPDPFLRRAFAAVWEDQLNLADTATLVKLADDSGLPGKQLVERSGTEEIGQIYEQNRQDALAADVFGSPAYVLDGEVFWGQDRIELLVDALKSGRGPYRSQV